MNKPSSVFEKLKSASLARELNVPDFCAQKPINSLFNWQVSSIYVERVERLLRQYEAETQVSIKDAKDDAPLITFAYWLVNRRIKTCTPNTWKSFRSALNAIIQSDDFRGIIMEGVPPAPKNQPRRTSRQRAKHVPKKKLAKLTQYISQSQSKYSEHALRWIAVTLSVGLRPKEWLNTVVIPKGGLLFLRVINAKRNQNAFTDSQGVLLKRHVPLWHLDGSTIELIETHIDFVAENFANLSAFEDYYESLRKYIADSALRCGINNADERIFSLYSCRQQFACDLKASDMPKTLKAYFLGHKDYATMKNHYGDTRNGNPILSLSAPQETSIIALREKDIS